jgi:hypothetical protein
MASVVALTFLLFLHSLVHRCNVCCNVKLAIAPIVVHVPNLAKDFSLGPALKAWDRNQGELTPCACIDLQAWTRPMPRHSHLQCNQSSICLWMCERHETTITTMPRRHGIPCHVHNVNTATARWSNASGVSSRRSALSKQQ